MSSIALVWLRRDLRLTDHPALHHAAQHHAQVLPVYVHAPDEEAPWVPGGASRWWLHHSLQSLSDSLHSLGSRLIIRRGDSLNVLRQIIEETGASAVYWNRLYEPQAIARDARIKSALRTDGLTVASFNGTLLFEPWEVKTGAGDPYRVYSPLFRALEARFDTLRPPLPAPASLSGSPHSPASLPLEALALLPQPDWAKTFGAHWQPGESAALQRLEAFAEQGLAHYHARRDLPAETHAVSGLSPHLHFGELSPHQALTRARQAQAELTGSGAHASIQQFIKELCWREFSHQLLYHFPHTPEAPLYPRFNRVAWREPNDYAGDLRAWQQGRTGIPMVDAGMRQLWQTGSMHNRVRMIAASLLSKNLLIPWQEGARWFWDTLVDASLPQNTMGWQWVAGCGADAAPYFRVFNPVLQGEKFDPKGQYVRHWVPELAGLPDRFVHRPWEATPTLLREAGLALDSVYRQPIVDLKQSRDRALAAYATVKEHS